MAFEFVKIFGGNNGGGLSGDITLGLQKDDDDVERIYIFIDGEPVGNGIALPSGGGASGDVVGNIDSENNIILSGGDIVAGQEYSFYYKLKDGSEVLIGSKVLEEVEEPDEPDTVEPTNWIKEVGYVTNTRLSTTDGGTRTLEDYECTDFIRAKYNNVLYIKNVELPENDNTLITFYDIEKTPIAVNGNRYGTTLYWFFVSSGTKTGDVYSNDIVKGGNLSTLLENFDGYIRICSPSITADSILTIDQAIS